MEAEEGRVEVIEIDLNEEPTESSWNNYQEMSNDIENAYSRIEERIRRLEAVSERARQRQQRMLSVEVVNDEALSLVEEVGQVEVNELPGLALNAAPQGRLDSLKRSDNHLLALALESNGGVGDDQVRKNPGEAFFDCNICFGKARDPILTCCGHLYCWPCFYLLPDVGPDTKECPACKGDVNDTGIIPIYGSSDKALKTAADTSGVTIPPRPRANRVESLRQQRISRGSHSTRIEEVLRSLQSFSTLSSNLSSALASTERIAEDLEGMAHLFHPGRRRYRGAVDDDSNSDVMVDVPSVDVVPDDIDDAEISLPSSTTPIILDQGTSASNGSAVVLLPRRINLRRRIHSQERFTDLTAPLSRRGRLRRTLEQMQHLIGEEEIMEQLSEILQSEENPPDEPLFIDDPALPTARVGTFRIVPAHSSNAHNNHETVSAIPEEANRTTAPSSVRRREYVLDTPEASGSVSPELRRRRRLG